MWQKIISDKEAHEDPVINGSLEIKGERQSVDSQFSLEIFSQDTEPQEYELLLQSHFRVGKLVVLRRRRRRRERGNILQKE